MTQINEEQLEEFKTIYEKHYKVRLGDDKALELSEKFIELMRYIVLSNASTGEEK